MGTKPLCPACIETAAQFTVAASAGAFTLRPLKYWLKKFRITIHARKIVTHNYDLRESRLNG